MVTRFASTTDDDLGRFRFHTGAAITRVLPEEACPPLFRDLGLEATALFLRRKLSRLCGPISPITYLRTAAYREPYTDYGRTGRIMLLTPRLVVPWHSGIETVYVAPRSTLVDPETMVFIPAEIPLSVAAERFADVRLGRDLAETIRPALYEAMITDTLSRLDDLQRSHEQAERLAAPLRKLFQSPHERDRDLASRCLENTGLCESDLCTAWHHLPDQRREYIQEALQTLVEVLI